MALALTMSEFARVDLTVPVGGDAQAQCVHCGCELRENLTGYRASGDGIRCSDCYFDDLSEIIEKHPVGIPGLRR